ncbi:MAG: hypothetical protein ABUT39_05880 [Acidobacteriota bacterium]
MASYSAEEILKQLDDCAEAYTFPVLDNAYVYPADTRMTLYRDEERWSLVIEVLGFNSHMGGTEGMDNALYCFGNCLRRPPGISPDDLLRLVRDGDSGPLFEEPHGTAVRKGVTDLRIRGRLVPAPPSAEAFELLRALAPEHRDQLLATDEELQSRLPADLPRLLRLDEWNHPDIAEGDLPSESPTFKMLAQVLETGDPGLYRPRRKPNTHWSNWPEGGVL